MASADILRAAHSPAPWERNYGNDIHDARGDLVAAVHGTDAEEEACNVSLILAAPAMLEALKFAQASLAMLTEPAHVRTSTVHQAWGQAVEAELKVRLAIAAAEAEAGR